MFIFKNIEKLNKDILGRYLLLHIIINVIKFNIQITAIQRLFMLKFQF